MGNKRRESQANILKCCSRKRLHKDLNCSSRLTRTGAPLADRASSLGQLSSLESWAMLGCKGLRMWSCHNLTWAPHMLMMHRQQKSGEEGKKWNGNASVLSQRDISCCFSHFMSGVVKIKPKTGSTTKKKKSWSNEPPGLPHFVRHHYHFLFF